MRAWGLDLLLNVLLFGLVKTDFQRISRVFGEVLIFDDLGLGKFVY